MSSVIAVEDLQSAADGTQFTISEIFRRPAPGVQLGWTGELPVRAGRQIEERGFDLHALLDIDPSAAEGAL